MKFRIAVVILFYLDNSIKEAGKLEFDRMKPYNIQSFSHSGFAGANSRVNKRI